MSEMVEKVEAALKAACEELDDTYGGIDLSALFSDKGKLARAAMEAMREPTAKMQIVGFDALGPDRHCPCDQYDCWQTMIDAALKEE